MPRSSVFRVSAQQQACTDDSRTQRSHPRYSKRRPKTGLKLRLIHLDGSLERPLGGAVVMLTDEHSITISGRSDTLGRISLNTGRSVVPLARLEVSIILGNGNCMEGGFSADELRVLNIEPTIHCNSTIWVRT